jgi:catechol 2,3-dioxygenase-like lactoylglutathione lyase family enzyme
VTAILRLARIRLNCRHARRLAAFYIDALGFDWAGAGRDGTQRLSLGNCRLDLVQTSDGGRLYPADVPGWDLRFQHVALAVADIDAAFERLRGTSGWRPISRGGPQLLPATSGGVTAFKFRDLEGHPLELIRFPSEPPSAPARIDHSAISVSDTPASLAFYQILGLKVSGGSLNFGPEQDRLDGLRNVTVEVTALSAEQPTPHLELLCYRKGRRDRAHTADLNDVAATRLVFTVAQAGDLSRLATILSERVVVEASDQSRLVVRDPDGHLLQFEVDPSRGGR